jgi:putative inorganic carbon (hco3(-)) transporter
MNVTKNDLFYILMSIIVAAIGVVAVSNTHNRMGLYGLMGLLGIAVVMAIIIRPSLGANILVIAIFTNISDLVTKQGYTSIGIIKPLVVVVAGALLLRYLYVGQVPIGHSKTAKVEYFLLAYFMVVIASYLVASDKSTTMSEITDLGKDIVIIYCILFALRESQTWKQTTWIMLITTALLCLLSVYQLLTHNYEQTFFRLSDIQMDRALAASATPRIGGPINAPNLWAQVLVAMSTLAVFRLVYEIKAIKKFAALLILGIFFYIILNTYSRGAYLVLGIDTLLILLTFRKRFNIMIPLAGVMILVLVLPFLPATYRDRFTSLFVVTSDNGIYQDTSLRGRSSEMLTGLAMFAEHPILGVGAGNYKPNYQRYAQLIGIEFRAEARDPHSLYVQLLAETGILGLIAFLGMVYFLFDALNKACRAVARSPHLVDWLPWISALRFAILSYLLTSIFLHNAYIRYLWILVAMALTGIQITYNLLENVERHISVEARRG